MSTTKGDLDLLARMIDDALDLPVGTHEIQFAYGRPRLVANGGAKDVSPRLPKSELEEWMRAYLGGINVTLSRTSIASGAFAAGVREARS